ncbi:MAG: lysylphosphatidylglycerol synthase transmembrane domain-containing protein [Candidatus Micrarchaeota archaeon]
MDKKLILAINGVVSLALVALILHLVGLGDVVRELGGVDLGFIALSMLCLLLMDIIMSYRISMLLDEMKAGIPFLSIVRSHFVGMLLADFTPSRAGYFATAAALKYNYGVPADKALLSIFGPQIFDFTFKVVAGSLAMLYIMLVFIEPEQGWVLIAGALAVGAVIVVMLLTLFSRRFLALFAFARKLPLLGRLFGVVVKMQDSSHVVVRKTPHIIALIFFSWAARAMSWYFAGKSVGISLDTPFPEPLFYFFLQPLVTMLEFVPSPTIAGLGLSEGGSTLVFSLFGIPPAKAATFALLTRFKTTFVHLPAVPEAVRVHEGVEL